MSRLSTWVAYIPLSARYMLLSSMGFALMSACVKALGASGIPVLEIVAARSLISVVISSLDIRRKRIPMLGHNRPLLLLRGVFGTIGLMSVFYSLTTLPFAQATVLQYTYPTFTAILALFFLRERVQLATIICIALSFVGLLVVTAPNWSHSLPAKVPWLSLAVALLGAFASGCAYVVVRKLARSEDSSVIILYFPMIAFPISTLLLGSDFIMPDLTQLLLILMVGVFVQLGQEGMTRAMAIENAGKVSAYGYVQVLFAALLGLLFFAEVPTLWTIGGGLLIVAGALINTLGKS